MKALALLLPVLAWSPIVTAQNDSLVSSIPQCAQSCLATAIVAAGCAPANQTCICTNIQVQKETEDCVIRSCPIRQALTTKNITATACDVPVRVKGDMIRVSNIVLSVVSALAAVTRIVHKQMFSAASLGWDDYFIIAALVSGIPPIIIVDRGSIPNGLGRDVWTVPHESITNFVHFVYTMEILYFLQNALIKLSLLFFLLRIFPKPIIRKLIWAAVGFTALWGVASVLAGIFQCHPISFYWKSWDHETPGKCININALNWSNAIISILLDIWMLAIPLYEVSHIQLSWRKKLGVACMFFVGTFVTVVSALRLQSLVHFATSRNPTWDSTDIIYWSNIEQNVGIVCACMPAIRVMLVQMFPRILGSRRGTTRQYGSGYDSRKTRMGGDASAMSNLSTKDIARPNNVHTISYSKTFDVQHQNADSDERALFEMQVYGDRRTPQTRNSSTSEISLQLR
ncbi:hypothetical protein FB567DRAFT_573960 [Paraphoma chrysanthemicola]|uniref:CFEM domain-containing protein n=1 Tax=Paraphoma chrysanthemicola TaxID=798071 RepID=A0A8K0QSY0_9PLEO|nr:hypothetical protein FB567DRAFT_573960 [Paraphoma chrysanthemicola]